MAEVSFNISTDIDLTQVYEALELKQEEVIACLEEAAIDACPVRTGRMRNSIGHTEDTVYVGVDYAQYTEYRTNWFSGAMDLARSEVKKVWQQTQV